MTTRLPAAAISFLVMLLACGTPSPHDYAAEIEAWRIEREARLKADDGWLTLAGLFFLNEGDNSFGSAPQNDIELRAGPERAGIITLRDGRVDVRAVEGQTLLVDGRRVDAAQLWPSEGPDHPTVTLGPLSLFCHESGDRLAIRLRDSESEIRREFTKLRWYPVDESFRISGRYVPHDKPRTMELASTLGDILTLRTSGSVALTVKGEDLRLTGIDYDGRLWFVFSDLTSGTETYPAARFLYADKADLNGRTTVDFNQPIIRLRVQSITRLARCRPRKTNSRSESTQGNSITQADASDTTPDCARWRRWLFNLQWNAIAQTGVRYP